MAAPRGNPFKSKVIDKQLVIVIAARGGAESLRLTTLRYQGGEATVLEVVDAQTTAAQAANTYEDGAVRYRVALANLQTLTGAMSTR